MGKLAHGTLLAFSDSVEYPQREALGDAAPKLRLYPMLPNMGVDRAYVAQTHNQSSSWSYVKLIMPESDGSVDSVFYRAEADQIARRYDKGSLSEELKLARKRQQELVEERDANVLLEQQLGVNNCPVSVKEIRALGILVTKMVPR